MMDWLIIVIALAIIVTLVGFFGYLAMKMNMSDPLTTIGKKDDNNQLTDLTNDKKKKDKNVNEQGKKKRKDQKKVKREITKDEEQQQQQKQRTKSKEPITQTSEETDDERDESERESSTPPSQNTEISSKARKRNKNKTRTATPPPPSSSTRTETNRKNDKNPVTTRAPPVTHPKSAPKDEVETTKQQAKVHVKSSQVSNKQTLPAAVSSSTTTKNTDQGVHEQPFTTVGGNRHKAGAQSSQQQNKSQANPTPLATPIQQSSSAQVHHEQLTHRQPLPPKETPIQANGVTTNPLPVKHQPSAVPAKVADLIKVLPSSQVVVTELMSALDAFPLSSDELDIIMHKIANKQSVIKQDWTKLQHGQKVDPQAHIGQVMDESVKAYQEDMKTNSMKRVKELTDELNTEKRRINELLKEKNDKEREIQILHAQLDSAQHKQQPTQIPVQQQQRQLETYQLQLQRLTEENVLLNQKLAQQQQLLSSNLMNNADSGNAQVRVLSEQMRKLSVENANWEKKATSQELLVKEAQKEKDDLIRYNEQLTQSLQNIQKELQHTEEKLAKEFNENRTLYMNQINEYKQQIEQLETDNEQLRREDIVHVEPSTTTTDIQTITLNNEEREQLEKEIHELKQINDSKQQNFEEKEREYHDLKQRLTEELDQYKKKYEDIQAQNQSQENELRQEIERLKQEKYHEQQQQDESRNNELTTKNTQIDTLRAELDTLKSKYDALNSQTEERLRQEHEKQRNMLIDLLPNDVRHQLSNDNQDFDQWFSSYRQIFESTIESTKRTLKEESEALKRENDQLHKNMNDVENQLKDIEKAVQNKEEKLFDELKHKDTLAENIRGENEQLTGEIQRLRNEIERLQAAHEASVNEARSLKLQLDERFLVAANSPSVVADESFELVKQPSPSLSPIVIDIRGDQLNDLMRSSKEGLDNQDSVTHDKQSDEMHHGGTGETSTSNVDESTASSTSNQQS